MSEMQEAVELSEGVALLLQRMKSHPNEFNLEDGKWQHVLQVAYDRMHNEYRPNKVISEPWMTNEEIRAIWSSYKKIKQKSFHNFVMKKLLDDGEEEGMSAPLRVNPHMFDPTQLVQPGSVHPGAWVNTTTTQTPDTPLRVAIKRKLGIK
jgi:hypothetical protein